MPESVPDAERNWLQEKEKEACLLDVVDIRSVDIRGKREYVYLPHQEITFLKRM